MWTRLRDNDDAAAKDEETFGDGTERVWELTRVGVRLRVVVGGGDAPAHSNTLSIPHTEEGQMMQDLSSLMKVLQCHLCKCSLFFTRECGGEVLRVCTFSGEAYTCVRGRYTTMRT